MRGPLSEIDGLRSRSRRGQLPWYSVLSPSCCHSCLGTVTPGGGQKHRCIQVPEAARAYNNNIILCQPWVKVSPSCEGLIDGCCKSMLRVLHGGFIAHRENGAGCIQLTELSLCFFQPFTIQGFQNKCMIETKLACVQKINFIYLNCDDMICHHILERNLQVLQCPLVIFPSNTNKYQYSCLVIRLKRVWTDDEHWYVSVDKEI